MRGKCKNPDCGAAEGLTCELGHLRLLDCTSFSEVGEELKSPGSFEWDEQADSVRLPWTGRAFGLNDLTLASARSAPILVGLIGPYNAGKTSFLTSLFAHLSEKGNFGEWSFAGSYTLQAWEQLKEYTSWPSASEPSFPPHTPDSGLRIPSLLHLAFRRDSENVVDILFTDAPGEWFSRWIHDKSEAESEGARWIAEHASTFLFFVDRSELAGERVGTVRSAIQRIARTLGEVLGDRIVISLWTKSDLKCDLDVEKAVRNRIAHFFGPHLTLDISVYEVDWDHLLVKLLTRPEDLTFQIRRNFVPNNSAFFNYKGGQIDR